MMVKSVIKSYIPKYKEMLYIYTYIYLYRYVYNMSNINIYLYSSTNIKEIKINFYNWIWKNYYTVPYNGLLSKYLNYDFEKNDLRKCCDTMLNKGELKTIWKKKQNKQTI